VNGTVVEDQPPFPLVVLTLSFFLGQVVQLLPDSSEEMPDEIQVLVFAISALDDPPVREAILRDDGNEGEPLALVDGAVDGDLFVGPRPRLVPGHVEVEPTFIQKVYLGLLHPDFLVLRAVVVPLFKGLRGVSFLGNALHSFLLETSSLQETSHGSPRNFDFLPILLELQVFDFIQLNRQFVLSHKGIFLDQPSEVLQPFESDLSFHALLPHVVPVNPLVERRVLLPFLVEIVDSAMTEIEQLSNLSMSQPGTLVGHIVFRLIDFVEFFG
jgi:hypothetical protein